MKTSSIASAAPRNTPIRIPRPAQLVEVREASAITDDARPESAAWQPTWQPVALEVNIISVLDGGPLDGESVALAFHRKEQELAAVFSRLTAIDSLALHRRLTLVLPGDPIAARFRRLVADRRARLLAFLADARRRLAVEASRAQARSASPSQAQPAAITRIY